MSVVVFKSATQRRPTLRRTVCGYVGKLPLCKNRRTLGLLFARHFGEWLAPEYLENAVYVGRAGTRDRFNSLMKRLRKALADTPLEIEIVRGKGNGQRRMVWRKIEERPFG